MGTLGETRENGQNDQQYDFVTHFDALLHSRHHCTMSLAMLVGGAECGPSNPLQSLSKRFDQDRGVQQVRAGLLRGGRLSTIQSHRILSVVHVLGHLER